MKFKVGDIVKIKTDLIIGKQYSGYTFIDIMLAYTGLVATITEVNSNNYRLDIDNEYWSWTDDMLEFLYHSKLSKEIACGSVVTFTVKNKTLQYSVTEKYLKNFSGSDDAIFKVLGIEDAEKFCKNCYGYICPNFGVFPEYIEGDYDAAQRVIDALQLECLKFGTTVKPGDKVVFKVAERIYNYVVRNQYLWYQGAFDNGIIFKELGIADKVEFCSKCYGYKAHSGDFPEWSSKDFAAAQKVIDALQLKCAEFNDTLQIVKSRCTECDIVQSESTTLTSFPDKIITGPVDHYLESALESSKKVKVSKEIFLTITHKSYKF